MSTQWTSDASCQKSESDFDAKRGRKRRSPKFHPGHNCDNQPLAKGRGEGLGRHGKNHGKKEDKKNCPYDVYKPCKDQGEGLNIILPDGLSLGGEGAGRKPFISPGVQIVKPGRLGTLTYSIEVRVPNLPAEADVFLLQDQSGSFKEDLPNVRKGFAELYESLNSEGRDVAFGVGGFVDKPVLPFGAPGDFVYQNFQAISGDQSVVQKALNGLSVYSGLDRPEAQLEALLQVAQTGAQVGWRKGSQRFVVLSTDSGYHRSGDGKAFFQRWQDNNGDGQINGNEDYPSFVQLRSALAAARITPIFAATAESLKFYKRLVRELGRGVVVRLSSDSDNLAAAIEGALRSQFVDVVPEIKSDEYGFFSSISPAEYTSVDGPKSLRFEISLKTPLSYGSDEVFIDFGSLGRHEIRLDIPASVLIGSGSADCLTGNNGPNDIDGKGGDDELNGKGGRDRLVGGYGNDRMRGGLGADTFVFGANAGLDVIRDFESSSAAGGINDVIEFASSAGFSNFGQVQAAMVQKDDDVQIGFNGGILTVQNVMIADLRATNFQFSG